MLVMMRLESKREREREIHGFGFIYNRIVKKIDTETNIGVLNHIDNDDGNYIIIIIIIMYQRHHLDVCDDWKKNQRILFDFCFLALLIHFLFHIENNNNNDKTPLIGG